MARGREQEFGGGGGGGNTSVAQGLLLVAMEVSVPTEGWWLHNPGKVLNTPELRALKRLISCSVNPQRLTPAPSPRPDVEECVDESRGLSGTRGCGHHCALERKQLKSQIKR